MRIKKLSQAGFSLVELLIAVGIMAGLASTVMMARSYMAKQTVATSDKAYATQKAIQMFEELKALVNGSETSINLLDNYSDGTGYNAVLTTDKTVDTGLASANPANSLSGNKPTQSGAWRYLRQIQVNHLGNDAFTRQIIIKVWLYQSDTNPNLPGTLLSEVGGNLRTIASTFPPTQVMDVYVLAINNIAGWWAHEPVLYQTFQSIINNIQTRNPGLELRPHYITRTSYGRDSQYQPYINIYPYNTDGNNDVTGAAVTNGTTVGNFPFVYMYPGYTLEDTADGSVSDSFFDPGLEQSPPLGVCLDGNFNVGGSFENTGLQFTGCPNYAVADQYNNSMRYPDELAMYQAVTAAAAADNASGVTTAYLPAQDSVTEISWRMLMEGMLDQPASFTNAMVINLHGENLPLPPMRNYSDAAKDPGSLDLAGNPGVPANTNIRVVTHPQMLYYPGASSIATSVAVTLNVYSYYAGLDDISTLDTLYPPANDPKTDISLFFPDLTTDTQVLGVTAIVGNSNTASNVAPATGPVIYNYDKFAAFPIAPGTAGLYSGSLADGTNITGQGPVQVSVTYVGPNKQLLITLYNSRLRCPNGEASVGGNNAGLSALDRLYGLEYIPCSPDMKKLTSPVTFTASDLTLSAGAPAAKNTARWLVSLSMPITSAFPNVAPGAPLTIQNVSGVSVYTSPQTFTGIHTIETRIGANNYTSDTVSINTSTGTPVTTIVGAPSDLSRTYVWTGWSSISASGVTQGVYPPTTEQYQFLGDPRHEPYLDVKVGGINNGQAVVIQPNGYNWWFKNGTSGGAAPNMFTDGYNGFTAAGNTNGWSGSDATFIDVPRFHQMIRQGLLNSTSIWTTMNGYTYYYFGLGGEFGSDQPPFSHGLTINSTVYNTTSTSGVTQASEMVNWNNAQLYNVHIPANTVNTWYAKTWLGELYPDGMVAAWNTYGNLPVANIGGPTSLTFYRQDYANLPTEVSATISNESGQSLNGLGRLQSNRLGPNGCSSFYQGATSGVTANGTMNHDSATDTDTSSNLAVSCYNIYEYPLPSDVVNANSNGRPWHLNDKGNNPPQFGTAPYNTYNTLAIPSVGATSRIFYTTSNNSPTDTGTGVVQITNTNVTPNQVAYVVESGLSISAQVGTSDLGETALVAMLRTFLDGGLLAASGSPGHVRQIPLVELYTDSPSNQYYQPTSIDLFVDGAVTTGTAAPVTTTGGAVTSIYVGPTNNVWFRFPGLTSTTANVYTEEYPGYPTLSSSTYEETSGGTALPLEMNFLYSTDSGNTWLYMSSNPAYNGQVHQKGILNTNVNVMQTSNSFPFAFNWTGPPGGFSQGNLYFMVEAYREGYPLNYAYHVLTVSVDE